jgi:phosphoribosylanthranilate isomerase
MDEVDSKVPVLLAGGINPENVAEALSSVNPDGIDLCSGVEAVPGKKDPLKVKALMNNIRRKGGEGEK